MNLGRSFWKLTRHARAARFWLLLALAALTFFGCNEARAQDYALCANPGVASAACLDRPQALAGIEARLERIKTEDPTCAPLQAAIEAGPVNVTTHAYRLVNPTGATTQCRNRALSSSRSWVLASECPAGTVWFGGSLNRCDTACTSRPTQTTLFNPKPGSMTCERGCMRSFMANGDGETMTSQSTGQMCTGTLEEACAAIPPERGNFVRNPILGACEPVLPECLPGTKPGNGTCVPDDFCPIGQVIGPNNTCIPQEGECPAGSTRDIEGMCRSMDDDNDPNKCPTGQTTGSDGTCKPDADNDGEPDDDTDTGTFSGGDSCKVPPMCSGDSIMCGQSRIQWRIDCNTRRNQKISGGGCAPNTMPVCVGESCDLMQYAQLIQAWNTRCAVEKLANGTGTPGGGENGDPDFDAYGSGEADANALSDGGVTAADIFTDESENNGGAGGVPGGTGELDTDGLGFSRGCVNLPSITVMGTTLDFNAAAGSVLCDWMRLGGQFVLVLAAFVSLRILTSGSSV